METLEEAPEFQISAVFKSYYVVWKRNTPDIKNKNNISLNRTMQYGNSDFSQVYPNQTKCLNRTMQYGN